MPSTRPPAANQRGTVRLDDRAWTVKFVRAVFADVQRWGLTNSDFRPTLEELLAKLAANPYQFPAKHRDLLAGARAADLEFRGRTWRLVFDIDDDYREVYVLAIAEHDRAYKEAQRRR